MDYVRIAGNQWVEDPKKRFQTTLDLRESLLRLIPRLEATILDDLPRHFRLEEGRTQRTDHPLLPQQVIREAVVNAVMHRDYRVNQPILVVRYSNRIEIHNAGYSLKPEASLGDVGSILRNPVLAGVLYDINFAETKGSGIRTMRGLLEKAGLTAPVFLSKVLYNQFLATYLLHQLLGEEQLGWLKQFGHLQLSNDEAKALILAWETGAIDNAGLRAITGLDTLAASQVLSRLHHQYHLLVKGGAGPATYYRLSELSELPAFAANDANTSDLNANTSDLNANTSDLPLALRQRLAQPTPKARKESLWPVITWLCAIKPLKAEQLASQLGRTVTALKTAHLNKLREQEGLLDYLHTEVVNHPEQAYQITEKGRQWLAQQGIELDN
ncbi:ATP-binding protein [Carnimonas nigrificans]|uniref:ATP-binding protein n=1 Tax=Carnimonas nigrificans TaxID=64323 RepID=UPI001FDF00DE|nr:ATP-binding protein [Carnimonas nigrificans]